MHCGLAEASKQTIGGHVKYSAYVTKLCGGDKRLRRSMRPLTTMLKKLERMEQAKRIEETEVKAKQELTITEEPSVEAPF